MNLDSALKAIADKFDLDHEQLKMYAVMDTIGGWDEIQNIPGETTRLKNKLWECGSIWEVEGQVLHALVRVLQPSLIVEFGSYYGCSTAHIAEALFQNGQGKLISVDLNPIGTIPTKYKKIVTRRRKDIFDYKFPAKVDFIFEDMLHTQKVVSHIWGNFMDIARSGAYVVSHDSEHFVHGKNVIEGIEKVTDDYLSLLIDPGKCGLAIGCK